MPRNYFMQNDNTQAKDPYGAIRIPTFRTFLLSNIFFTVALLMQSTIIGWHVYVLTNDKLVLGLLGLSEAVPFIITTFYSGYLADTFSRRKIIIRARFLVAFASIGIFALMLHDDFLKNEGLLVLYFLIGITGMARSFMASSHQAYMSQIIPRNLYANGATWSSFSWNIAAIIGPVFIGYLYQQTNIQTAFSVVILLMFLAVYFAARLVETPVPVRNTPNNFWHDFVLGLKFAWKTEAIILPVTLDLLVVLFGSVMALLPAFAKDILHVEQGGLGLLRAAQFIGSAMVSVFLMYYPPTKAGGRNLLLAVAGFSLCMFGFAFSTSFILSLLILIASGAFDGVSVVIRNTIIQLYTPDEMRGRVSATTSIFVKSSNEIGDFESGVMASFFGLEAAVIIGGLISLSVVLLVSVFSKKMRELRIG